jgi:hypothetical protein
VFVERYENLYKRAKAVFNEFKNATHASIEMVSKEVFLSRVKDTERTQKFPSMDEDNMLNVAAFVLPQIILDTGNTAIMEQITPWLLEKWKTL